jgi:hypothetical protein
MRISIINRCGCPNVGGSAIPMPFGRKLKTHQRETTGILRNVTQGLKILMSYNRWEQVGQPAIIRFSGRTLLQEVV